MLHAQRDHSIENVKQICLAFHLYKQVYGTFPPAVLVGPDGKTRHSWRVAILPFLDMKKLQKRLDLSQPWSSPKNLVFIETVVAESGYKFDEAWDSKNNKEVLKRMPQLYRNPRDPADSTSTSYFALTGPTTIFSSRKGIRLEDIRDDIANTIMLVETKRQTPWTKPVDVVYQASKPLPELGGIYKDGYHVGFADGSWGFIPLTLEKQVARTLMTVADGEPKTRMSFRDLTL
jgi:hypothetical protein